MVFFMLRMVLPILLFRVAAHWWFSPGQAHVTLVWLLSTLPQCVLQ
jgi:hypothetical protein